MRRNEYPRPIFVRENWQNLNGTWDFTFDDTNVGHQDKWYINHNFDKKIEVPFCFQSELSGIGETGFHDHVWYKRKFSTGKIAKDERVILHIGACDYESEIYINKQFVFKHIGGHSSFKVDITDYLTNKEEEIVIYAFDPSTDEFIPRGKQYWKENNEVIWYTRTTGLWQTVWLEKVNSVHLDHVRMTPNLDEGSLDIEAQLGGKADFDLEVTVMDKEEVVVKTTISGLDTKTLKFSLNILKDEVFNGFAHGRGKTWSPENPYLFDINFKVIANKKLVDNVDSYFGMRKIHSENGIIFLNNRPYFQKLILDQGYFEDGLLTAPSDQDLINDIKLSKEMGFNGCRKHQVTSEPRFLYHADRLGYIVWGEMANSANYNFDYVERITREWTEIVRRDYNHPSIVTWVPLNESWGVPNIQSSSFEQNHSLAMYHLTKSLDDSRLVISNDGWEMTRTDITAIHNYNHGGVDEPEKQEVYEKALKTKESLLSYFPAGRNIYVDGFNYNGEPIMLTEFGGISFINGDAGWGYTSVKNEEDFLKEYKRLILAIGKSEAIVGFCYTQLTDVFQEINGLLTFDRKFKVNANKIKEINDLLPFMMKGHKED